MNRQIVIDLLKNPALLPQYTYAHLNELSEKYPHFTALKFLIAQKAKQTYADKFEEMLPNMAVAIPNRTRLYQRLLNEYPEVYYEQTTQDYWQDQTPTQNPKASEQVKQDLETLQNKNEVVYESTTDPLPTEEIRLEVLNDLTEIKEIPKTERNLNNNKLISNIKSRISQFKKNKEAGKFGSNVKPVDKMSDEEIKKLINADKENVQEIENYLRETYGEQLDKSPNLRNSIKQKLSKTNVTETLAKIYEQQGDNNKAIQVYKELCKTFPSKQDYFLDRIKMLQELT